MPYRDKNKEKETRRAYHQKHRAEILLRMCNNAKIYKLETLTHYGKGKLECVQCGFQDIRTLTIDHLNGGGVKHRQITGNSGIYRWLKKQGFPEGFQTLCMNCQYIKRARNKEYGKYLEAVKVKIAKFIA